MWTVQMPRRHPVSADFHLAGFRNVDASADAAAYLAYLDSVAGVFRAVIEFGVDALQLRPGDAVLDMGCGHGACMPLLAQRVGSAGRIAGVDASRAMVAEARNRLKHAGVRASIQQGDAHELPFEDGTFDAARADRVFMFLDDPARALAELVRVTKPGGRICVTEGDIGSHAIDATDRVTTRAVLAALSDRSANGCVGRHLRAMFVDAGLSDVAVQLVPILTTSYAEWNDRLGVEPFVAAAVADGRVASDAAMNWLDELRARDAQDRFTGAALLFVVVGRRPPGHAGSQGGP